MCSRKASKRSWKSGVGVEYTRFILYVRSRLRMLPLNVTKYIDLSAEDRALLAEIVTPLMGLVGLASLKWMRVGRPSKFTGDRRQRVAYALFEAGFGDHRIFELVVDR